VSGYLDESYFLTLKWGSNSRAYLPILQRKFIETTAAKLQKGQNNTLKKKKIVHVAHAMLHFS